MPQGTNAQYIAYQYEKLLPRIEELMQGDATLFDKIEKRNVEVQSSRAMRGILDVYSGTSPSQVDPDGGDFGRGKAIVSTYWQLSPVFFSAATEFTKYAEVATDGKEKAVEPAAKRNLEKMTQRFKVFLESLLNSGSTGSGTIDTIVSTGVNQIVVGNANQFQDQMNFNIFPALGAAPLVGYNPDGTVTVLSNDATTSTQTVYLTGPVPAGTAAGYLCIIAGAPGVASTSLFSLQYHQNNPGNTGTWLNLARSAYPGRLITPQVNLAGFAVTPAAIQRGKNAMKSALGIDNPNVKEFLIHMNTDQDAAWQNLSLTPQIVVANQLKGGNAVDMLQADSAETVGGMPKLVSIHAKRGRIDGLVLKHWGRGEIKPIGPLDFGGQTLWPIYGASGGLSAATITYIWGGFNFFVDNPRAGVYWPNAGIPASY
jgi:hypothetical protein